MNSSLYISGDANIYENTATMYAVDIYNAGTIYVEGNIHIINGIYLENRESVLNILHELPSSAVIQLEQSNYVIPDESLAPIVVAVATDSYPTLTIVDLQTFRKPQTGFENWEFQLAENNTQIVLAPIPAPEEYTITYLNLHGATQSNPTTYTSVTPTFTLYPPTYIGCKYFLGWYDDKNQIRRAIIQGTTGNIVLTAKWQELGCCKIGYVCRPKVLCCKIGYVCKPNKLC